MIAIQKEMPDQIKIVTVIKGRNGRTSWIATAIIKKDVLVIKNDLSVRVVEKGKYG